MNLLVKPLTGILGLALTVAGIAGFFTSGMLFVFQVDATHNVVHLVSGLVGLFAYASSQLASRWYLMLLGIVYAVIAVIGFSMGGDVANLFMINMADNWLHAGIAATCLVVSFGSGK